MNQSKEREAALIPALHEYLYITVVMPSVKAYEKQGYGTVEACFMAARDHAKKIRMN